MPGKRFCFLPTLRVPDFRVGLVCNTQKPILFDIEKYIKKLLKLLPEPAYRFWQVIKNKSNIVQNCRKVIVKTSFAE